MTITLPDPIDPKAAQALRKQGKHALCVHLTWADRRVCVASDDPKHLASIAKTRDQLARVALAHHRAEAKRPKGDGLLEAADGSRRRPAEMDLWYERREKLRALRWKAVRDDWYRIAGSSSSWGLNGAKTAALEATWAKHHPAKARELAECERILGAYAKQEHAIGGIPPSRFVAHRHTLRCAKTEHGYSTRGAWLGRVVMVCHAKVMRPKTSALAEQSTFFGPKVGSAAARRLMLGAY